MCTCNIFQSVNSSDMPHGASGPNARGHGEAPSQIAGVRNAQLLSSARKLQVRSIRVRRTAGIGTALDHKRCRSMRAPPCASGPRRGRPEARVRRRPDGLRIVNMEVASPSTGWSASRPLTTRSASGFSGMAPVTVRPGLAARPPRRAAATAISLQVRATAYRRSPRRPQSSGPEGSQAGKGGCLRRRPRLAARDSRQLRFRNGPDKPAAWSGRRLKTDQDAWHETGIRSGGPRNGSPDEARSAIELAHLPFMHPARCGPLSNTPVRHAAVSGSVSSSNSVRDVTAVSEKSENTPSMPSL